MTHPHTLLDFAPCEFREAKEFVSKLHRHHRPPQGHRFSLKAVDAQGHTVGVAIVGRPVARNADDGATLEVTRLCTDGTPNCCSFLIGKVKRAARALGYSRLISYTLSEEHGASWRASGMTQVGTVQGKPWVYSGTPVMPLFGVNRNNDHPLTDKRKWEVRL